MPKSRDRNKLSSAVESATAKMAEHKGSVLLAQQSFQGPVPHPELLRIYEEVVPGAAERLIALAEKEQSHRHELDKFEQNSQVRLITISESESKANLRSAKTGQYWGLAVTVACVACAFITAMLDKPWQVSAAFLTVPTASFINALRKSAKPDDK